MPRVSWREPRRCCSPPGHGTHIRRPMYRARSEWGPTLSEHVSWLRRDTDLHKDRRCEPHSRPYEVGPFRRVCTVQCASCARMAAVGRTGGSVWRECPGGRVRRHRRVSRSGGGRCNLTRAALPVMRQQRRGHIIQNSSPGGRTAFPGNATYCVKVGRRRHHRRSGAGNCTFRRQGHRA